MQLRKTARWIGILALVAGFAFAQQTPSGAGAPPKSGRAGKASGNMADRCQQMMSMRDRMMAEMKAMDATLDQKVAAMNAARGNAKVDAMAAVINEMASQRKQMIEKMSSMRDRMMAHMGDHMAQSGSAAVRQSMEDCPMMKGMAK